MPDLNEIERGQLCQSTIESLYEATGGLRQFPSLLKKVIATRAWERRTVHGKVVELGSLRELITAKPVSGWGEDPSKVEAVIRDDPEALAAFREAMKHQGERPNLDDNVIEVERSPVGNSRAYSISRVQRECDPDTVAGEHHARRLTAPARPSRWARLQARAAMLFDGHEIIGSPARVQNCERPSISAWSRSRRPTSAASRAAWPSVSTSSPRMKRSTAAGEMPAARARSAEECSLQAIA